MTVTSTLLTGLISYWKFDETTGTNLNDEVGTSDGTSTAAPTASGKIGYCQEFSDTDYISVPITNLIPLSDKFSVSMWYKMTTLPTDLGRPICLGMLLLYGLIQIIEFHLMFLTKRACSLGLNHQDMLQ